MVFREKYKKGVTLIEILIGLVVFSFVVMLVAAVYMAHFRLFSNQSKAIDVASSNRLAVDEITNQIRESQSVVTTCSPCGGDTTGTQILILQLWPVNASGDSFDPGAGSYDYVEYRLDPADPTKLLKKVFPAANSTRPSLNKVLSVDVSSLQFAYNNADVTQATEVTITLTNSGKSISKEQSYTQSSKATLRNK